MNRTRTRRAYVSPQMRRKRRDDRLGMALILASALAFSGMLWGAYEADKARGITIAESLDSAGL